VINWSHDRWIYLKSTEIVSHNELAINRVLNCIKACQWDFFVNLRCQTGTTIVPIAIKYSMCDLIFDVSYCSSAMFLQHWSYNANDLSFRLIELWIPFVNHLLHKIHMKICLISISPLFRFFIMTWSYKLNFSRNEAWSTVTDDVTN